MHPQTAELLHSCMHPSSVLRVDLLTRSFTDLKPSLAKYAKQATGKELQGGTEPWFGMEAAWMEVGGRARAAFVDLNMKMVWQR